MAPDIPNADAFLISSQPTP